MKGGVFMRKIAVKRIIYAPNYATLWREQFSPEVCIGGEEYDGKLTDHNILSAMIEVGKWYWASSYGDCLIRADGLQYARVHTFYQYQKSWYNLLSDSIKRILRI